MSSEFVYLHTIAMVYYKMLSFPLDKSNTHQETKYYLIQMPFLSRCWRSAYPFNCPFPSLELEGLLR